MVKKVKKTAGSPPIAEATPGGPGLLDSQFGQLVKESAQQIWSAGLAAFAKAQNNSGKAFDTLAEEGARLQKKTQASAEERLGTVASRMSDMAGEVGTRAGQHWDKLESIFEDRVARALHRLGVPTSKDLEALQQRLDALTQAIQSQGGRVPAAKAAASAPVDAKPAKAVKALKAAKTAKTAKPAKTVKAVQPVPGVKTKAATKTNAATKTTRKTATKAATASPAARKSTPGTRAKR